MRNINLRSTNNRTSMLAAFITIAIVIITFIVPFFFINVIPQSTLGNFIIKYTYYTYLILPIIFYISITGIYYYSIKIDAYVMNITSYRTILDLLRVKNYIEVPHDMLRSFSFFNRPLTFNNTLMLKIENIKGKIIIKRFNLSFLSKSEKNRISKVLEQIIAKNR